MQRQQFTFYRSFWDALRALPKKDQLSFVTALCAYALDGEESDVSGSAASAYYLAKPVLDTARRRADSGKQGGSKTQAKRKQTASEKEKEKEKEGEVEIEGENECYTPSPSDDGDAPPAGDPPADRPPDSPPPAVVPPPAAPEGAEGPVVAVAVRVVGQLSAKARSELDAFVRDMGDGCVLRALDAAQDAGKPTWSYVRGVLRRKREQGVTSLADWDRVEARFQRGQAGGGTTPSGGTTAKGQASSRGGPKPGAVSSTPGADYQPTAARIVKHNNWLDSFLAEAESGR